MTESGLTPEEFLKVTDCNDCKVPGAETELRPVLNGHTWGINWHLALCADCEERFVDGVLGEVDEYVSTVN